MTQVRKAKKFEASKDALMVNTIFANDLKKSDSER